MRPSPTPNRETPHCTPEVFEAPLRALSYAVVERLRAVAGDTRPDQAVSWFHARRDAYIEQEVWSALDPAQQHVVLAHITSAASPLSRLVSHRTAALAWGIPIIGATPTRVEMLDHDQSTGVGLGIQRHRTQNLPVAVIHDGLRLTDPCRTAVDVARVHPLATGLAALDDVLHRGLARRDEVAAEIKRIPRGARGRARVKLVAALADGASESAAESLSRAQMFELGMPKPQLQVRFDDVDGFVGRTDMYWPEIDTVGEVVWPDQIRSGGRRHRRRGSRCPVARETTRGSPSPGGRTGNTVGLG